MFSLSSASRHTKTPRGNSATSTLQNITRALIHVSFNPQPTSPLRRKLLVSQGKTDKCREKERASSTIIQPLLYSNSPLMRKNVTQVSTKATLLRHVTNAEPTPKSAVSTYHFRIYSYARPICTSRHHKRSSLYICSSSSSCPRPM